MPATLRYISMGRGGSVIYQDDLGELSFSYEFGAGDCVAILFVPSPAHWEAQTGRPAADRTPVLTFVARQAVRDQAAGGTYRLYDDFIEIYRS